MFHGVEPLTYGYGYATGKRPSSPAEGARNSCIQVSAKQDALPSSNFFVSSSHDSEASSNLELQRRQWQDMVRKDLERHEKTFARADRR